MLFGEKLRELRKERNMTQDELGLIIGVKKAAIQKLESGSVQSLKISNIKKLCELFDISPTELLLEKEDLLQREVFILDELKMMYGKESIELLHGFTLLNETGQAKVIGYCSDLKNLEYYKA